jgi:hypothetical protein
MNLSHWPDESGTRLRLTADDLEEITEALRRAGAASGPMEPLGGLQP